MESNEALDIAREVLGWFENEVAAGDVALDLWVKKMRKLVVIVEVYSPGP